MKNSQVIKDNKMTLTLTLNNIKSLFFKWNFYIYFVLFVILIYININYTIKTVYAMEHIYSWKHGIYYVRIKFNFISLRNFILCTHDIHHTQMSKKDLIRILKDQELMGLFYQSHIFLIYNNVKVLSSLTHSNGIENIFLNDYDYIFKNEPQYLGEPFDYTKNKIFLNTYSKINDEEKLFKYFLKNEESILKGLEKQLCKKPVIIEEKISNDIKKFKIKQ
mgnify:CR=1 FL=1